MENAYLKLSFHPKYLCEVLEEIILYNEEKGKIIGFVAIVEKAERDVDSLLKRWKNKELST